uniref:Glycosyl transferase family 3 domain-containing protein n=1 Tax=Thermosporothrix sp. COM3 TaxID=2490863 RepID=A0A455SVB9_9CHLR|nr:hypothetical protein KTC_47560 [Thermosporothrix sp. COM3]
MLQEEKNYKDVESHVKIEKGVLRELFSKEAALREEAFQKLHSRLGPLHETFEWFLQAEKSIQPPDTEQLKKLFDSCSDPDRSPEELLETLYALEPGNSIGFQQINMLVDHLRGRVWNYAREKYSLQVEEIEPHDHVFGSGGDFCKTLHASTAAAIVASTFIPICKTGTSNVTSWHGSTEAMTTLGYTQLPVHTADINRELAQSRFAFIPLSALGFPYSPNLRQARKRLWEQASKILKDRQEAKKLSWQKTIRTTPIPMDIFKIVSPNAQVLKPRHHSTGVCSPYMLPYVLSLYLHLNSQGIIVFSYDGIDEFSTASSEPGANNLVIQVREHDVLILECGPEALGLKRSRIEDISEKDLETTRDVLQNIFAGKEEGAKQDFIVANAALLLVANGYKQRTEEHEEAQEEKSLQEQLWNAVTRVREAIQHGEVKEHFENVLHAHFQPVL